MREPAPNLGGTKYIVLCGVMAGPMHAGVEEACQVVHSLELTARDVDALPQQFIIQSPRLRADDDALPCATACAHSWHGRRVQCARH